MALKITSNYKLWHARLQDVGLTERQTEEVYALVAQAERYQLEQIEKINSRLERLERSQ